MKMRTSLALSLLLLAGAVGAQQPDSTRRSMLDTLFARARQLVLEGNGVSGRALVDSLVAASLPGTPAHVDALFWRASLAGTASDAERDYRRIIVEYPLSPRSADALLSLSQLEIARGDRDNAALHLQRFLLDHPDSPDRARASVSLGRMLIEQGRTARGCAVIGRSRNSVAADAVELRNQMDYYAQRCDGVDTVEAVAAAPARTDAAVPRVDTSRRVAPQSRQAPAPTVSAPPPASQRRDTATPTAAPRRDTAAPKPAPTRDTATKKVIAPSSPPPSPSPSPSASAATAPAPATAGAQRYSVQVAAFETKAEADQLADRLKTRGLAARVFGTARPFRVRIGRYASETVAADVLKTLRAQGMNGFVTPAEPEAR